MSWEGNSNFSIEYPSIGIHAISTDPSLSPRPCLLVQVSGDLLGVGADSHSNGEMEAHDDDDETEEDDEEKTTEIKFVPEDPSSLETLYSHMSRCQALHPDPDDSISEEDEEDDYEGEEDEEWDEEGSKELPTGGGGDEPMDMGEGQFEDA